MNLGFAAGEILLCNSCLRKSESGVPPYVALHSTSPSFFTAHRNMTSASFWPFLTNSCSSMRLINALGPWPINTGRNIGSPAAGADGAALACPDGVALPCDHARSTTDNKAIKENANTRMARYASGARRFFKCESEEICQRRDSSPTHWEEPNVLAKSTLDGVSVAKTGDILRTPCQFHLSLAEIEARRILGKDSNVFLIAICIDYS